MVYFSSLFVVGGLLDFLYICPGYWTCKYFLETLCIKHHNEMIKIRILFLLNIQFHTLANVCIHYKYRFFTKQTNTLDYKSVSGNPICNKDTFTTIDKSAFIAWKKYRNQTKCLNRIASEITNDMILQSWASYMNAHFCIVDIIDHHNWEEALCLSVCWSVCGVRYPLKSQRAMITFRKILITYWQKCNCYYMQYLYI